MLVLVQILITLQVASNKVGAGQVVTNLTTAFTGTVTVVSVAANNQDITIEFCSNSSFK